MAFLVDNGDTVIISQASQEIPTPVAFQTDDLDTFDSNYDEAPSASVVLIAKLSAYDLDVLSGVPTHDIYLNNHLNDQIMQEMWYTKQSHFNNETDVDITSDSNINSYEKYLKEIENLFVQNTNSTTQQGAQLISVIEEMSSKVAKCTENEGSWGFEHIQKASDKDVKRFVKTLKENFHIFYHGLHKEITDMKEVFTQMETEVAKCFIEKKTFKIKEKELLLENDCPMEHIIYQDVMSVVVHAVVESKNMLPANNDNLEVKLLKKKNDRLLGMYKLDLDPLSLKLLKNKEARVDYLKHTQEHAETLHEIVEHVRDLRPLDSDLDSACKFAIRVQELLAYVRDTCPSSIRQSDKLIAVTPINKVKKVSSCSCCYKPADLTGSPLSTSIDQDVPSNSTSSTTQETHSLVIFEGIEEPLHQAPFDDPFLDILTSKPSSQESSSLMQPTNPPFEHIRKWTKIHPLENVIGNPSRPVST
nr:hypothetical protein [Tanacetum cinerariifolium]